MDVLRHDLFYWQLVHYLVIEQGMRVIEVSPSQQEIWLEHEHSKKRRVLRIVRADIDWANWLRREIDTTTKKFDDLRKQFGDRSMLGLNIYVSTYSPIDAWEHHVLEANNNQLNPRTNVETFLLENRKQERVSAIKQVFERIMLPAPNLANWDLVDEIEMEYLKDEVLQEAKRRRKHEESLFTYGKPIFTYVLLAVILLMFSVVEYIGSSTNMRTLIEFGAKYNPLIVEGEWWRFFSAMFLHIGFLHLFMNSFALFYLGGAVEKIFGTRRFIIIYLVAGLFGSAASFAFNEAVSAGASGAIFGCFGALLYFGVIHRRLFWRTIGMSVVVILTINLALGFAVPMIDNGAHIGGLVGGFLASAFVHLPSHLPRWKKQFLIFILTSAAFLALLGFGFVNDNKSGSPLVNVQLAQEYIQDDKFENAYPLLVEAIDEGVELAEAYFLLAYVEAHLERFEDAHHHLLLTIELREDFHEAHYNLALIYLELGQDEEALTSVTRALEHEPDDENYRLLYEELHQE
ncbi:rhomboid family protein [Desertibacillus haloalkaliphilus]|uniref:rhomboid family protein n=1 Tax=Desertibacillus haloalkaliphilus TaxID=1328930 RepID=UPI001C265697|nr:rhomboid family intramembrane serine protease [Desertibacillus haloalkaliphilus]MBU8905729.1 rhomboid family intramembrane serine protease [Desertibacillus haloalkaliphilus]